MAQSQPPKEATSQRSEVQWELLSRPPPKKTACLPVRRMCKIVQPSPLVRHFNSTIPNSEFAELFFCCAITLHTPSIMLMAAGRVEGAMQCTFHSSEAQQGMPAIGSNTYDAITTTRATPALGRLAPARVSRCRHSLTPLLRLCSDSVAGLPAFPHPAAAQS